MLVKLCSFICNRVVGDFLLISSPVAREHSKFFVTLTNDLVKSINILKLGLRTLKATIAILDFCNLPEQFLPAPFCRTEGAQFLPHRRFSW